MQIRLIAVRRAGSTVAICFESALELNESAEPLGEMRVGVQHVTLQPVAVVVLRSQAPLRIVKVFVADARFSAEREIRIAVLVQRYVFDGIEQVVAKRRAKIRVIFIVAE